jgi:GNAT superfamily N-acetyltransferase
MTASPADPARSGRDASQVKIASLSYDHSDAATLLHALYDEQLSRYGFADPIAADPAAYAAPRGLFLVAYLADLPAACGGYRHYNAGVVEIKKLYTVPEHRGQGLARRILSRLEEHAALRGARSAVLETGSRSHAALALFRHAGYRPTACYVAGRDPAVNRAFIKDLSALGRHHRLDGLRATAR